MLNVELKDALTAIQKITAFNAILQSITSMGMEHAMKFVVMAFCTILSVMMETILVEMVVLQLAEWKKISLVVVDLLQLRQLAPFLAKLLLKSYLSSKAKQQIKQQSG